MADCLQNHPMRFRELNLVTVILSNTHLLGIGAYLLWDKNPWDGLTISGGLGPYAGSKYPMQCLRITTGN